MVFSTHAVTQIFILMFDAQRKTHFAIGRVQRPTNIFTSSILIKTTNAMSICSVQLSNHKVKWLLLVTLLINKSQFYAV